jgi:alpha-L-rhamnosidase
LVGLFPFNASVRANVANTAVSKLVDANLGSPLLQKIFRATLASHTSNLWSIPTDCPQREKRGWMADAGLSAASLNFLYDAFAFHVNFLRLVADNQRKLCVTQPVTTIYGPCSHGTDPRTFFNGSVPDTVPFSTGPYGGNPGTTDWQVAYIMIARSILVHNGDLAVPVLAELWFSLELFMTYLERLVDSSGLLLTGARGDWVPPDGAVRTQTSEVAAFSHTLCVAYMAEIAAKIGRDADSQRYKNRLAANQVAYHARFFKNTTTCCYGLGTQTSNVFALYIGAVPASLTDYVVKSLVASIESQPNGPHLQMGIFGTTYVFDVLHAFGRDDVALKALTQTTYPSFGYMISQDATTLWEAWDGTKTVIGQQGTSRNHIMFGGGVNRFLVASVTGLSAQTYPGVLLENPLSNVWKQLIVHPAPFAIRSFNSASASRRTASGMAKISWERTYDDIHGKLFVLNINVPHQTTADLQIPLLLDESLGSLNNTFITLSSTSLSADIVLVCSVNEYVEIVDMPAKANELMGTVKILQGEFTFVQTNGCWLRRDNEVFMALKLNHHGNFHVSVSRSLSAVL